MTDVKANTLYQCGGCKEIFEITDVALLDDPCPNCNTFSGWMQLPLVLVCDFCSVPTGDSAVWSYPAEDFFYSFQVAGSTPQASKGEWAACEECHALIESDDRDQLAVRSVASDIELHPEYKPHYKEFFGLTRVMHDDFFRHRTGDAVYETAREHYERKEREQ